MLQDIGAAAAESDSPVFLAVTPEGGHSLTWPEGWRAEGAWACEVVVEWVRYWARQAAGQPHGQRVGVGMADGT